MSRPQVILLGGASGAGKTTLGRLLAARLGAASLTVDDLLTVAQEVTTPERHPDLFVMKRVPSLQYFTESSVENLKADAEAQHRGMWPLVRRIVEKHAGWEPSPIVIDGWHLRPQRVAELQEELEAGRVWAAWLVAAPEVLQKREEANTEWMKGSTDPDRMLRNFLARSLWFNQLVKEEAVEHGFPVIHQPGAVPAETLCDEVLTVLDMD